MNSLGRLFRVTMIGESHGPHVGVVIDGCPAGISLSADDFSEDLLRRKPGKAGTTPRSEDDIPHLVTGIFNGKTTGAPLTILFDNKNVQSRDYDFVKHTPRPGHADYTGHIKFGGYNDHRGGGHFSARLTVALVAAGVVAKKICADFIPVARITELAGEKDIEKGLQKALDMNDSVGGIIECTVNHLPVGLGEPFFDSVESLISHAVFSVPAVKGIEFGSGFAAAKMTGSVHNDAITDENGKTATNYAGGINGGLTNGNPLVFRVAIKPASSTPQKQETFDFSEKEMTSLEVKGRHDLAIALRAPVVIEAVTAIVLADLYMVHEASSGIRNKE